MPEPDRIRETDHERSGGGASEDEEAHPASMGAAATRRVGDAAR